jgi:hypothetical protein
LGVELFDVMLKSNPSVIGVNGDKTVLVQLVGGSDQKIVESIKSTFTFTDNSKPVSNLKTYTNAQYAFSLKYPSDWTIKDLSLIDSSKNKCPVVKIESPARYGVPGYENDLGSYRILISACTDIFDPSKIKSIADFGNFEPNQQSWWGMHLADPVRKTSPEYSIGQTIISSFVLTK